MIIAPLGAVVAAVMVVLQEDVAHVPAVASPEVLIVATLALLDCHVTVVRSSEVGAALNVPNARNCSEPDPLITWLPGMIVTAVKSRAPLAPLGTTVN